MHFLKHSLSLCLLLCVLCQLCWAMPSLRVKRQDDTLTLEVEENKDSDLNPINMKEVSSEGLERNKRKLPDATFEAKNAVLGFVFGSVLNAQLSNVRAQRATGATKTNDDIPEFDRTNVSLDFPDELFNKSFATLTNVSKSLSRLIMNSARRYSRFVLFFKPIFGDALIVKGFEDPTTTTTTTTTTKKPTTSTTVVPEANLNEI